MAVAEDVKRGRNVSIFEPCNIYGCEIGDNTKIGAFVEIKKTVKIGRNCKVEPFSFIPEGVTLEDGVFIGPHVVFTNDKYPRAVNPDGSLKDAGDWKVIKTLVKKGASVGAGAVVICGITIGEGAVVAAGSVATKDVPPRTLVAGVPARVIRTLKDGE